jgi:hypothetical protein
MWIKLKPKIRAIFCKLLVGDNNRGLLIKIKTSEALP